MTKEIIYVDALLDWCNENYIDCTIDLGRYADMPIIPKDLINKIKELTTSAEPQESIFDADRWCRKLKLMPRRPENYKCLVWLKNKKTGHEIFKVVKTFIFPDWFYQKYDLIAWQPLPTGGNQ